MSDTRLSLAQQVRKQLTLTERSNEQSIAESARLMAILSDTGLKLRAAPQVAHDVMEEAFAGLAAGMELRRRNIAAHKGLVELAGLIGVDVKATGGSGSKSTAEFTAPETNIVEIARSA